MSDVEPDGVTPLDPDEAADLIPGHITTRDELNSWEQANILTATEWGLRTSQNALDEATIRELHRRMFDETWLWAGRYRTTDTNIGVHWAEIATELRKFVDDGRYWIERETFGLDEAALRLHHRLVMIHPFPNGNGRHARLWCDLLLRQADRSAFQWKSAQLDHRGSARRRYISALRRADAGDFEELFELFLRDR